MVVWLSPSHARKGVSVEGGEKRTRNKLEAASTQRAAAGMAPGGAPAKHIPPKPPDRGSFPLDHFRECSDSKKTYILCLKEHDMQAEDCRHLAGAYLQCRMDTCAGATTSHAPYLWA